MINRMLKILLMTALMFQTCAQPRFRQRDILHKKEKNKAQWELVLRATESRNRTLKEKNLLSYIRLYLGTPYQYGGASLAGIDCSGLVMVLFNKALNMDLPRSTELLYQQMTPISLTELRFGDLLFFEISPGNGISHVGIYLSDAKFVHASIVDGVTLSDLHEEYYRIRYRDVRRVADLKSK